MMSTPVRIAVLRLTANMNLDALLDWAVAGLGALENIVNERGRKAVGLESRPRSLSGPRPREFDRPYRRRVSLLWPHTAIASLLRVSTGSSVMTVASFFLLAIASKARTKSLGPGRSNVMQS